MSSKSSCFFNYVIGTEFDVYTITETKFHKDINSVEFFPSIFVVYRCDRSSFNSSKTSGPGGGVLIAVNKNISSQALETPASLECVAVQLEVFSETTIIVSIYIPPRASLETYSAFTDFVCNLMSKFDKESTKFIIIGDFNLPNITWVPDDECADFLLPTNVTSATEQNFVDTVYMCGLNQINSIKNYRDRYLDLVFSNFHDNICISECFIPFVNTVDHKAIEISITNYYTTSNIAVSEEIIYYDYRNGNISGLSDFLANFDWLALFSDNDININIDKFYELFLASIDEFVPKKSFKSLPNYPPHFTKELIKLRNYKNRCRVKFKKHPCVYNKNKKIDSHKLFIKKNKEIYNEYIQAIESKIYYDPKCFWKFVNSKCKSSEMPTTMYFEQNRSSDLNVIVEYFKNFFQSVYKSEDCSNFRSNLNQCPVQFDVPYVSESEIINELNSFKNGCGPDGVSSYILKLLKYQLCYPLKLLFDKSLKTSTFPQRWKISSITPIYKAGDRSNIANYRGISILSSIPKLFEAILTRYIFFNIKNIISTSQHGFFKGRSTTTNLIEFQREIIDTFESHSQLDVGFVDFTKAFDSVQHQIIICKLKVFGLSEKFVNWVGSYLSDRIQYVKINRFKSSKINVLSGVPQGSHLGPLLFTIFVNDLLDVMRYSKGLMYADDMKLLCRIGDHSDAAKLQSDLDSLSLWCSINHLNLNIKKCAVMSFSRKKSLLNYDYKINNETLTRVAQITDLGVTFDPTLSFIPHINKIIAKSSSLLGFIQRLSKDFKDKKTLQILYSSLVRSNLEYAIVVWAPHYNVHIERIEKIQRKFTRQIFFKFDLFNIDRGLTYLDNLRNMPSYIKRCFVLNLEPLTTRRCFASALFVADVLEARIDSPFIISRLNIYAPIRQLRARDLLIPDFHRSNYSVHESINFMISNFNNFCDIFDFGMTKACFKNKMKHNFKTSIVEMN